MISQTNEQKKDGRSNEQDTPHVHCLGVGGIGMSGLAHLMLHRGWQVSGSDLKSNVLTRALIASGANIYTGHRAEQLGSANWLVKSSDIPETNPELIAARKQNIPVLARAEMLAKVMQGSQCLAVTGTHGKTTTTGLLIHILRTAQRDPSFMIGGVIKGLNLNAHYGSGLQFVTEADESDASFMYFNPDSVILTNVDTDHLGAYQGQLALLREKLSQFIERLPKEGLAVVCYDDPCAMQCLRRPDCRVKTYGTHAGADFYIQHIEARGFFTQFDLQYDNQIQTLCVNLPGRHNVLNATAAAIVAADLQVSWDVIAQALLTYPGVGRRFNVLGEHVLQSGDTVTVVDDYAHHPREIAAVVQAAQAVWPDRRIITFFQPHRFTRTRDLWQDFVDVLSEQKWLVLSEIYSAQEAPITDIDGMHLSQAILGRNGCNPLFIPQLQDAQSELATYLQANDVLLCLGAGSITEFAHSLIRHNVEDHVGK